MSKTIPSGLAITAAAILWMPATVPEAAEPPGELWETTSQMSMGDMSMPQQTVKICARKDWQEPPGGTDPQQHCRTIERKVSGPKMTWTVQCDGPPAMNGVGEITRESADSYSGLIRFTSEEMTLTLRLSGRKIGSCDEPH